MFRFIAGFLICSIVSSVAIAQKRVALVIGNSAYQSTPALTNPQNDATDMAAALKAQGFQVVEGFDLDKSSFDRKVRDFAEALSGARVGVFFYAGHGLQVAGNNYLVPVDAKLSTAAALDWEMVRLDLVQRTMERETDTSVLFLDACRDNPLTRNLARAMGTRSAEIGRGLAPAEAGVGTLISFSTQPGNVALDGTGRNSPFAGALVKRIGASGDDLSALLIDVRNDVRKETSNKQVPWEHSSLTGRFYFKNGPGLSAAPAADATTQLKPSPPPQERVQTAAPAAKEVSDPKRPDGRWNVNRVGPSCVVKNLDFPVVISKDRVEGEFLGKITGAVTASGEIKFSHPNQFKNQAGMQYTGKLTGSRGNGTFVGGGNCSGTFTLTRE